MCQIIVGHHSFTESFSNLNDSVKEWQDTIDFGLENYLFTALITEPTPVKDLIKELTEHSILVWYDEREQKVKMDSIMCRDRDWETDSFQGQSL